MPAAQALSGTRSEDSGRSILDHAGAKSMLGPLPIAIVVLVALGAIFALTLSSSTSNRVRGTAYQRYADHGSELEVRQAVNICHTRIFQNHMSRNGHGFARFDESGYWAEMDVEVPKAVTIRKNLYGIMPIPQD